MSSRAEFVITGGRVIDPAEGRDGRAAVYVRDGAIVAVGEIVIAPANIPCVDAAGLIVCPGLIDIHVHLREPGEAHKETIAAGTRGAAAGGFTAVCCMPNTIPPIDNVETLGWVQRRAKELGASRVYPVAAVTRGRSGTELVDFDALVQAGAVAFSDDGEGIEDDMLMSEALDNARRLRTIISSHSEFKDISQGGVMHLGSVSERLGLVGYNPRAEEAMIERDLALVELSGARLHVTHVSTAGGVELIRYAKSNGLPVTAEVTPHHLLLTDKDVVGPDGRPRPNFKMNPPLREPKDVAACLEGVRDGTIDCVVTDHAPHAREEKELPFVEAPMGVVGLETSLATAAKALLSAGFGWPELIERMSTAPARVFDLPGGSLRPGAAADITIIDPGMRWIIDPAQFQSKGRNTPFAGWEVRGKAVATVVGGAFAHIEPSVSDRFRLP